MFNFITLIIATQIFVGCMTAIDAPNSLSFLRDWYQAFLRRLRERNFIGKIFVVLLYIAGIPYVATVIVAKAIGIAAIAINEATKKKGR